MTIGEVTQIITALAAASAVWVSARNSKKISEVHIALNSRLSELIASTRSESHAAGVAQEKNDEAARKLEGIK